MPWGGDTHNALSGGIAKSHWKGHVIGKAKGLGKCHLPPHLRNHWGVLWKKRDDLLTCYGAHVGRCEGQNLSSRRLLSALAKLWDGQILNLLRTSVKYKMLCMHLSDFKMSLNSKMSAKSVQ